MLGKTHAVGGVSLGIAVYSVTHVPVCLPVYIGSCIIGALLPDIDHPNSLIGKYIIIVPQLINIKWAHRTITHSLLFLTLVYVVLSLLTANYSVLTGITIGTLSHLVLDSLTVTGVPWLYPFNKQKFRLLKIKTGSYNEFAVGFLCVVMALISIFPERTYEFIIQMLSN